MSHLEIKTRKLIDSTLAQKIVKKGTVWAVLTTGKITTPAKKMLDRNGIAWAENIPEQEIIDFEPPKEDE